MYVTTRRAGIGLACAVVLGAAPALATPDDRVGETIKDVSLKSLDGKSVNLLDYHTDKVLVVAYTGRGCPVAGRYAPRLQEIADKFAEKGVKFVGINANPQDAPDAIVKEIAELGLKFPVLKDDQQSLTEQLDAKTTTEVFVVDAEKVIRYRGMIDDQYAVGVQRDRPKNLYLEAAIRAAIDGESPRITRTAAPGCLITRVKAQPVETDITYASHTARIIQDNCQSCHRPGQIAPFPLTTYEEVSGWSAMIYFVLLDERMPPWNAGKDFDGHFLNERKISEADKNALMTWIDAGMPRGNPDQEPPAIEWPKDWRIGQPDKVFKVKKGYTCPEQGVVEYQHFSINTNYREDKWIRAIECQPGASDVVHHIVAYLRDPKSGQSDTSRLGLEDGFLAAQVPGDLPSIFPPGYAKKLPAGHDLILQVHYTTNGKQRVDRSSIAMIFTDEPIKQEVFTRGIYNMTFSIPPGESNYEVRAEYTLEEDIELLSFYPHMHFRGKDFTYVAHMPDGSQQALLTVPRYDYNWQESYILKKPILLPAGAKIECIAHYDNSKDNFVNPDPTKTVTFGEQSWDEMMFGYIDYAIPSRKLAATEP
jgi:peroxiredoxin